VVWKQTYICASASLSGVIPAVELEGASSIRRSMSATGYS
jgi:hypothetical protein